VSGEWLYEFNLESSRRLVVSLLPEGDGELPDPLFLNANSGVPEHADIQICEDVIDGQAVIRGLPEGPAVFWVYGADQRELAYGQAVQGPGESHTSLRLTSSELAIRLVSVDATPVPMAQVFLRKSTDRLSLPAENATNDEGIARLPGFRPGAYEVHVTDQSIGVMVAMAELDDREEAVTEIVFQADHALGLSVTDDLGPIVGVNCRLSCANDRYLVGARSTVAGGTAEWDRISAGDYVLSLSHPTHWPISKPVELTELRGHVEVQMPRLGSIALRFQESSGSPARGLPVALFCQELEASVEEWIAAGQIQRSASSLATDESGALELSGIPCGRYEWSAGDATGVVQAVPDARPQFFVLP